MITHVCTVERDGEDEDPGPGTEVVEMPIDGVLDLHTFSPRDVADLVREYVAECQRLGILDVRIIHGKGTGVLRRVVHAELGRMGIVESFRTADETSGGWGATLVRLRGK